MRGSGSYRRLWLVCSNPFETTSRSAYPRSQPATQDPNLASKMAPKIPTWHPRSTRYRSLLLTTPFVTHHSPHTPTTDAEQPADREASQRQGTERQLVAGGDRPRTCFSFLTARSLAGRAFVLGQQGHRSRSSCSSSGTAAICISELNVACIRLRPINGTHSRLQVTT